MKKSIILTAAVALVLLSGCVQQEGLTGFEQSNYRISLSTDNSVLVDMSVSEKTQTRASYDTIIDVNDGIGIYCLPDHQIITSAAAPTWSTVITENSNVNGIYWDNAKCNVGDLFEHDEKFHKLELDITSKLPLYEYYPMVSTYAYKFYGYAPFQEGDLKEPGDKFVYAENDIQVIYNDMTGTTDILWAESEPGKGDYAHYAYSGAYFRKIRKSSEVEMNFEHMLTKLNFYAVPKPNFNYDGTPNYESVDTLVVKSIRLLDQPKSVALKLAARKASNGSFVADTEKQGFVEVYGEALVPYTLRKDINTPWDYDHDTLKHISINNPTYDAVKDVYSADTIRVGTYLMTMPAQSYQVEIVLCSENYPEVGIEYKNVLTITPSTKQNPKAQFEAGKEYNIKLGITGPVEISLISANILEWEEGEDVEVDFDNVPDLE